MGFIPNTTCRRCHRQYPSFRSRCPYCGTKKVREVRSSVPETDSAVPGTQASRNAAEALNLQMLIGGVLVLAVIITAVVLVSVNVGKDFKAREDIDEQIAANINTPIPLPTATPSPSPTPAPQLQDVQVRWGPSGTYDYVELGSFRMPAGSTIPLCAIWYPTSITAMPEWSVDDETIVSISPNESGIYCDAKMVGQPGQSTVLHVKINEREEDITVEITE